jgi:hypothetical protein
VALIVPIVFLHLNVIAVGGFITQGAKDQFAPPLHQLLRVTPLLIHLHASPL